MSKIFKPYPCRECGLNVWDGTHKPECSLGKMIAEDKEMGISDGGFLIPPDFMTGTKPEPVPISLLGYYKLCLATKLRQLADWLEGHDH